MSGFAPVPAGTRQSLYGQEITGTLLLRDGVSPVLTCARTRWSPGTQQEGYLELTVSEELAGGDSLPVGALLWKSR